jgi:hypothetical protein
MTNNKQQTAVEWFGMEMGKLFAQYHGKIICIGEFHKKRFELEEKAKEMEKERIIEAFDFGDYCIDLPEGGWKQKYDSPEQYYKQTYGGGEQ